MPSACDVVEERRLEDGVVVPVVQRAGAGQKVEMAPAVHVEDLGPDRALEDVRKRPCVGLHLELVPEEHVVLCR